jgi:hypothetical protein
MTTTSTGRAARGPRWSDDARRRFAALAGMLGLLATFVVAATGVGPTSSAWTNPAHHSVSVTAGTWAVTPTVGCTVMRLVNGVETVQAGKTCSVTATMDNYWSSAPSRVANVTFAFTYSGATYPDYFLFTIDMRTATGVPSGWSWTTSGSVGANLVGRSACSALPYFTATTFPSWGPVSSTQIQFHENRTGVSGLSCTA